MWDELAQGSRRVLFRRAGGGTTLPADILTAGRIASYPAIAAVGDGFVVAWTDQSDGQSVIRARSVR